MPVLDDIPVMNNFFRYDSTIKEKTELLIIMTPHIVKNQAEAEALKRTEAAKMSWCLNDVTEHLRRSGPAAADRRVDRRRGPRDLSGRRPAARRRSAGRAGNDSHAQQPARRPGRPRGNAAAASEPLVRRQRTGAPIRARHCGRFPGPQRGSLWDGAAGPTPAVQPASYQSQPWQASNTAQPAVYQAPVAEGPARSEPLPSFSYQPPPPPYEPPSPAYYPPNQGTYNR